MTDSAAGASTRNQAPAVEVSNLHVTYQGSIVALEGVDFTLREGDIAALIGPNGAGKSTTLKAITGLLASEDGAIAQGDVRLFGSSVVGKSAAHIVRGGVAQALEGRRVFKSLTVQENLAAGGYTRSAAEVAAGIEEAYSMFPRLAERHDQKAGLLSGGEQQMLAISRALMARPKVLLLDEPSLGLAPMIVSDIFRIIREVNTDRGMSVLLVEQNANAALGIADHAFVVENGRVVLSGSADELRQSDAVMNAYLGAH